MAVVASSFLIYGDRRPPADLTTTPYIYLWCAHFHADEFISLSVNPPQTLPGSSSSSPFHLSFPSVSLILLSRREALPGCQVRDLRLRTLRSKLLRRFGLLSMQTYSFRRRPNIIIPWPPSRRTRTHTHTHTHTLSLSLSLSSCSGCSVYCTQALRRQDQKPDKHWTKTRRPVMLFEERSIYVQIIRLFSVATLEVHANLSSFFTFLQIQEALLSPRDRATRRQLKPCS